MCYDFLTFEELQLALSDIEYYIQWIGEREKEIRENNPPEYCIPKEQRYCKI